jgi:membrane protease YdiL (CAAX protease family)
LPLNSEVPDHPGIKYLAWLNDYSYFILIFFNIEIYQKGQKFLSSGRSKSSGSIIELLIMTFFFGIVIYLLSWPPASFRKMLPAILIIFFALLIKRKSKNWEIRKILSALAGGFLIFSLWRYTGFVRWPLGHPSGLNDYLSLLLNHIILVLCVISPLLWVSSLSEIKSACTWGKWKDLFNGKISFLPYTVAIGFWLWAFFTVYKSGSPSHGKIFFFLSVAFIKAILTSGCEEFIYRGVIQKIAVKHYGIIPGIIMQALLYTVFHINLGAAFFNYRTFIFVVFILGLTLGWTSYRTRGIGLAFTVHTALGLVIEWQNIL